MYHPYYGNYQSYHYGYQPVYWAYPNQAERAPRSNVQNDFGPTPFVIDIEEATKRNKNYRTALWTGSNVQVTVMSLNVGEDIGLEVHPHVDQFICIEEGHGLTQMGPTRDYLNYQRHVAEDTAIMVPAGTWHNVTNTGDKPLKLYTIYAPPNHPFGTVQVTKADALAGEAGYGQHD
ncbi:cupin domain-containing protein [Lysinibacillus sp. OL1_EC]|uniref:cupin domain-containing protein n=1 Tax=unclassified Lysinibacillus TaxID=2636778 RepID=UPI00103EF7BD|nr:MULTISPECIES: cupin domain-containing protein [unclassified Lysinibacillus]MCM0624826.1 cupin domain-containing protein [Lysinibacillus sp. OL1_EC]TBV87761.1 cupin domain-containing protein [Lysinibacillus sp. OL1]